VKWPDLTDGFEILALESSKPETNPFRRLNSNGKPPSSPVAPKTAAIIGRMTNDQAMIQEYQKHAQYMDQRFYLSTKIADICTNTAFRPIVHAEVLIMSYLESINALHPSRFFQGEPYIASSKPTCRLCHAYFEAHSSGFQVRPTHGNLYHKWRLPDVPASAGQAGVRKRRLMLDAILIHIRKDAFRMLRERVSQGKAHDSETNFTWYRSDFSAVPVQVVDNEESPSVELSSLRLDESPVSDEDGNESSGGVAGDERVEVSDGRESGDSCDDDDDGGCSLL
jgi:hypothetical protein